MKLHDSQQFMSLYYEPDVVEIATGEAVLAASVESWERETKQLGQVATPDRVAQLMAKWVMSAKPRDVLDPAAGLGGLLAACQKYDRHVKLVGTEFDAKTFQCARATAPCGTKLILADYLKSNAGLFEGIIANPPYVKAQRLDYTDEDWRYFEERFGTPLDRMTNLYALFLLKIWEDLAPHGRAAVILPAEFLNANFGEEIKERLLRAIRPRGIMVFAPSVSIFADALTTSAIVLLDKGRSIKAPIWAKLVESVEEADQFLEGLLVESIAAIGRRLIDLDELNPRSKWLNLLLNGVTEGVSERFSKRVGDYFDSRRGIATGANDFFCLSRATMRAQHLTEFHVEPCITKATDADGLVFSRNKFDALADRDRRCFLLNPSRNGESLARYLEIGERRGIPRRHLPSHRPVWYLPENRAVADIWVAVFSRESVKFILNTSGAKNLTCFHGLYAKPGNETLAPLLTLFLNSSMGMQSFSQVNRFYGDGLNKLEPKDVEDMPCPEMPKLDLKEAEKLIRKLSELELLSRNERTACIDKLAAHYFDMAPRVTLHSEEPASSPLRQDRSRRPAGRHTHRDALVR
jgi:adenine-specific DNA-methyltransferase